MINRLFIKCHVKNAVIKEVIVIDALIINAIVINVVVIYAIVMNAIVITAIVTNTISRILCMLVLESVYLSFYFSKRLIYLTNDITRSISDYLSTLLTIFLTTLLSIYLGSVPDKWYHLGLSTRGTAKLLSSSRPTKVRI